ncbi:MAG: amidohydrolase [Clostridium sp.]|uniref:amidohydrolase n=1 Tax=Clostridium sp. TaxID=1506 RepID=UPI003021B173
MEIEENLYEKLISLRREFHRCAEIGWLEFETTFKIMEYLKKLGYNLEYGKNIHYNPMGRPSEEEIRFHRKQCENINVCSEINKEDILNGYTGVVASLYTGIPGPTVAFRFDIDGLTVDEGKEGHVPYEKGFRSENLNVSHSCGHDAHIAVGLMLAETIVDIKEKLKGTIKLIFQPAEEEVRGAKSMVDAGVLNGVDYLFSGHIGFIDKNNAIGLRVKDMLATNKLEVTFRGKSAHAGICPEEGRNALLAAASCILNLHCQVQYGSGIARLNVGTLHGGAGRNIIADKAILQLETRGNTNDINNRMMSIVENVVKGTSLSFGVEYEIKIVGAARAYNSKDDEFTRCVINEINNLSVDIAEDFSFGASEDITYMMEEVEGHGGKSMYFIFSSKIAAPHHNSYFDFNEESMVMAHYVYKRMIETFSE